MEKCKFCEAELEENSSLCPACGKDNAEAAAEETAVEAVEATETAEAVEAEATEKPMSAKKAVFACIAVVLVVAMMVGVFFFGRNSAKAEVAVEPTLAADVTEPATLPEPTIPADGNPDDVTCKGTYTAADDAVIAARDTVVATAGDAQLTVGQLQVFYWLQVHNFMSQYGNYAPMFGLDIQQPLDMQVCGVTETPMSWQQFFLESALNAWASCSSMVQEAQANGYTLSADHQALLDGLEENINASAVAAGFESGDAMIKGDLGNAATFADYANYMEHYLVANGYYSLLAEDLIPDAEQLDAYFQEHVDSYAQAGITKETKSVNVRHILVYPEGATAGSVRAEEFSEDAWAAGEANAQALLTQWLEGEATEESFAAMANEHSQDPGSNTNGGLYEGVTVGQMVPAFNDWCFDPARQVGDSGVVKTEYGFHVMYFSGSQLLWEDYAKNDYMNEHAAALADEIAAKRPISVEYGSILLAESAL